MASNSRGPPVAVSDKEPLAGQRLLEVSNYKCCFLLEELAKTERANLAKSTKPQCITVMILHLNEMQLQNRVHALST